MKKIYESRIIILNVLAIILVVAEHFGHAPDPVVLNDSAEAIIAIVSALTVFLRMRTTKAIEPLN